MTDRVKWRDMTDTEKGNILMRWRHGGILEVFSEHAATWVTVPRTLLFFEGNDAYRIRPSKGERP